LNNLQSEGKVSEIGKRV